MNNKGIKLGPPFGRIDHGNGLIICCICAEPIDGFRRKGDKFAALDEISGLGEGLRGWRLNVVVFKHGMLHH